MVCPNHICFTSHRNAHPILIVWPDRRTRAQHIRLGKASYGHSMVWRDKPQRAEMCAPVARPTSVTSGQLSGENGNQVRKNQTCHSDAVSVVVKFTVIPLPPHSFQSTACFIQFTIFRRLFRLEPKCHFFLQTTVEIRPYRVVQPPRNSCDCLHSSLLLFT